MQPRLEHRLEPRRTVLSFSRDLGDGPEAGPAVVAHQSMIWRSTASKWLGSHRCASAPALRRVRRLKQLLAPVVAHLVDVQGQVGVAALHPVDRQDLVDDAGPQRLLPAQVQLRQDVVRAGHQAEEAQVAVVGPGREHLHLGAGSAGDAQDEEVRGPGVVDVRDRATRTAPRGSSCCPRRATVATELPRVRDLRPAGPTVALQRGDDPTVETNASSRGSPRWPFGSTCSRSVPRGGSRVPPANSSASSICGECPDFSNTTSLASGIRDAITSLLATGVIQSSRPTVTSVGQVIVAS